MKCQEFKDSLIISIYGELTSSQKNVIDAHILECPECARLYQKTQRYQELVQDKTDLPLVSWDKSWEVISENVLNKKRSKAVFIPYHKFILAGAAVCIIFIIGFFTGKQLLNSGSGGSSFLATGNQQGVSLIKSYAESIELILINFRNHSDRTISEDMLKLEQKIISDMLIQTRILEQLSTLKNEPGLKNLFEDLEVILVSLSNLRPENKDVTDQLQQFIRERRLEYRIRHFTKTETI